MNFEKIKYLQFSNLVKAENRLREFNFTYHSDKKDRYFTVDVVDDRGNRIIFEMKQENKKWMIQDKLLPNWITSNSNELSRLIEAKIMAFSNLQNEQLRLQDFELNNDSKKEPRYFTGAFIHQVPQE